MFPRPEGMHIGKGAAEIFVVGSEDLGGSATVGFATDRVFDRVHKRKRLTAIGQRDAIVPAFKETPIAAVPVVAAVWGLQTTGNGWM
jgi:hypothetical protein